MASLLRVLARQGCRGLTSHPVKQRFFTQPACLISTSKKHKDSATASDAAQHNTGAKDETDEVCFDFGKSRSSMHLFEFDRTQQNPDQKNPIPWGVIQAFHIPWSIQKPSHLPNPPWHLRVFCLVGNAFKTWHAWRLELDYFVWKFNGPYLVPPPFQFRAPVQLKLANSLAHCHR